MLAMGMLHGALVVGMLAFYGRWVDEEALGELCLYGLVMELFLALALANFFGVTDSCLLLDCGAIQALPVLSFQLLFFFDALSGYFLGILTLALIFCFYFLVEYFEYDAGAAMIINLSALFSQAALLFFSAFDLFSIILFWELISIVSFLLVQHWSHRLPTYKAGLKVFTISQVGDLPLLFFIFACFARFETTSLLEILPMLPLAALEYVYIGQTLVSLLYLLALLLSAAVFLKAAQFFFYPWLLDAMEAPVPISAQLHSSTLVVIGFYLFYRFQALFMLTPELSPLFLGAGVFTVVGASLLGFFQIDGKRLLACSTASQLGYIVVSLGLGLYEEGLLLLAFCCCNKAFTFVWFGALMNRHAGVSDFRFLGGVSGLSWFEHAGLLVAICNFTILPGAFSWHAKGLFLLGEAPLSPLGAFVGLEVLQLTWFFSSLYLISLYLALFARPLQGKPRLPLAPRLSPLSLLTWAIFISSSWSSPAPRSAGSLSFFFLALVLTVALVSPELSGFWGFTDVSWASASSIVPFSYY